MLVNGLRFLPSHYFELDLSFFHLSFELEYFISFRLDPRSAVGEDGEAEDWRCI